MPDGMLRIATWNVNSIRTRLDRVLDWLKRAEVDVLAMQETKCSDQQFPAMPFLELGYETAHCGFNQWNGVAIASRVGLDNIEVGFDGQPTWSSKPDVAAAAFHGEDAHVLAGEGVFDINLGAGVAAAEVGDAQIGAQQVGAIAQTCRRIKRSCVVFIPKIGKILEGHTFLLVFSSAARRCLRTKSVTNSIDKVFHNVSGFT